jgi:hypothetical protein
MQGIKYHAATTIPEVQRKFNSGHARDGTTLRQLQFTVLEILRPLGVLCHALLPITPIERVDRDYVILNGACTLVLHFVSLSQSRQEQSRNTSYSFFVPDSL